MEKKSASQKKSVKDEIIAGVRPKAKEKGTDTTKKKSSVAVVSAPKKGNVEGVVTDNVKSLPKEKQAVYITAKNVGATQPIKVDIRKITATSKVIYVADIHAHNPQILATVYWIIMPNTNHVVLRVTEKDYNELLQNKEARSIRHLVSVIDNAVFPSLTYGSWQSHEIKDFPTHDQIDDYDAKFKTMELNFHNAPVFGDITDLATEDEFEIDFSDEDEMDEEEEEEGFDFSENDTGS